MSQLLGPTRVPRVLALVLAGLGVAALVGLLGGPAVAQDTSTSSGAPAPRLPDGRPNLNGVWRGPYVPDMTRDGRDQKGVSPLPFTPAGQQDWDQYDAATGDYTGSCLPFGLMRSVNAPYPFQIVQSNGYVTFLFEVNNWFHVVPLGRDHPVQPQPTWFGDSVGRWDGDSLVIDTINFNGYTRLDTVGHPHGQALHLVQTFRLTGADHLAYTVRIEDPETYTRPWTNERVFTRADGDLIEYSCEENNRSLWEGRIRRWSPP